MIDRPASGSGAKVPEVFTLSDLFHAGVRQTECFQYYTGFGAGSTRRWGEGFLALGLTVQNPSLLPPVFLLFRGCSYANVSW